MAVDLPDWTSPVNIVGGQVSILGTAAVSITGTPAVTVTSGTISIGNVPNVIIQSGTVAISGIPSVSISGTPSVNITGGSVTISSGSVQVIGNVIPVPALGDLQGGVGLPPITPISVALAAGASAAIVGGTVNKSVQYFHLHHETEGAAGTSPEYALQDSGTPTDICAGSYAAAGADRETPLYGVKGGNGTAALLKNKDSVSHNHRGMLIFRQV